MTRPAVFLAPPLTASALRAIFLAMLTGLPFTGHSAGVDASAVYPGGNICEPVAERVRAAAVAENACTASSRGQRGLWAGIILLLTAGLAVLMVTESAGTFLMLSTVATAARVVAGTGASRRWFLSVLRRLALRLRFAVA